MADDFDHPDGLAFSADERQLYISDSARRHIRLFSVTSDAGLAGGPGPAGGPAQTGGSVFATCDAGTFDGLRLDSGGRIWAAAGDGLHCIDPDGTLIGKIAVPETVANLTFGGPKRNQLFICATSSLYSLMVNVTGMACPA